MTGAGTPLPGDAPLFSYLPAGPLGDIADEQVKVDRAVDALAAAITYRDKLIAACCTAGKVRQVDVARVTGLSRGRVSQIVAVTAP